MDRGDSDVSEKPPAEPCRMTKYQKQQQSVAKLAAPRIDQSTTTLFYRNVVQKSSGGTSIAALKAKCSSQISKLAKPYPYKCLPQMHYVTSAEREVQRELEEEMTKEELKWLRRKPIPPVYTGVKKSALRGKCTQRLETMAMAKFLYLIYNRRNYYDKMHEQQRNALNRHIEEQMEEFRSNHPPEGDKFYKLINGATVHTCCSGREEGKPPRYICELNKAQRRAFRKRMKQMGLPRLYIQPNKGPDRGPKRQLKEFEPRLTQISQPRWNVLDEVPYDPFAVKPTAKFCVPTERTLEMARPKTVPPPPPFFDFEGNEMPPRREWSFNSRRRIIPTPRVVELATPRFVKKKAAEDSKEDPFAVPRRALTAWCSPRIKELAEPMKRD